MDCVMNNPISDTPTIPSTQYYVKQCFMGHEVCMFSIWVEGTVHTNICSLVYSFNWIRNIGFLQFVINFH